MYIYLCTIFLIYRVRGQRKLTEYEELFVKSPEIILNKKFNTFSVSIKINTEGFFDLHYGYLLMCDTVCACRPTKAVVIERNSYTG